MLRYGAYTRMPAAYATLRLLVAQIRRAPAARRFDAAASLQRRERATRVRVAAENTQAAAPPSLRYADA